MRLIVKALEKHVNRQLSSYVEANGLLHATQSGFLPLYNMESALLAATELLRSYLDGGGTAAIILFDLRAAFDTVFYKILLDRLHEIGYKATHGVG